MTLLALFCLLPVTHLEAQIKIDLKKKIEREANKRANQKADKAVKKTFDSVEEGVTEATNGENSPDQNNTSEPQKTDQSESSTATTGNHSPRQEPTDQDTQRKPELTWARYDFVPGPDILFEDNLEGEQKIGRASCRERV